MARILSIEDDDDIATVIAETLRVDGHRVDRASDGLDGLWMSREGEGDYRLIVLDILMPGMNGYQVCEALRSEGNETPILMLTAKVGEYDETEGLDGGADDYLRKPFSPEVFLARVRALLRRNVSAGEVTHAGGLGRGAVKLDPRTRRCLVDDREVALTGRQAQLLEALLESGDTPKSRGDLLVSVWGFDFDGDPNIVDVNLRALRSRIGNEAIENVHGLGYRVRA